MLWCSYSSHNWKSGCSSLAASTNFSWVLAVYFSQPRILPKTLESKAKDKQNSAKILLQETWAYVILLLWGPGFTWKLGPSPRVINLQQSWATHTKKKRSNNRGWKLKPSPDYLCILIYLGLSLTVSFWMFYSPLFGYSVHRDSGMKW